MTLGTGNKKQVVALIGLGVVALYLVYTNVLAGPSTTAPPRESRNSVAAVVATAAREQAAAQAAPTTAPAPARSASSSGTSEFHPVFRSKRAEDRIDPLGVDPTLRLDLLAKLKDVEPAGSGRNLFQFGAASKPAVLPRGPEPIVKVKPMAAAQFPVPMQPAGPPPPPPIRLKYYGSATVRANGQKTGFFLDGDEILVGAEGETLRRRYRVVRLAPTSVVMEDIETKNQQTLRLEEGGA